MSSRGLATAFVMLLASCALPPRKQTVHAQRIRDARGASLALAVSPPLAHVEGSTSLAVADPGKCFFGGGEILVAIELGCAGIATGVDVVALPFAAAARYAQGKQGESVARECLLE